MKGLGGYRLLSQLGAGPDGVVYRAERAGGDIVEVHVLAQARADNVKWLRVARRLRVAATLEHSAARRLLHLALEDEPPFFVVGRDPLNAPTDWESARPIVDTTGSLELILAIARRLVAAHRVGLVHGRLDPSNVRGDRPETIDLNFIGLETGLGSSGGGRGKFVAPEAADGIEPTAEADVYRLGALTHWLLTGRPPTDPAHPPGSQHPLGSLIEQMLVKDPDERPTAIEVEQTLVKLLAEVYRGATDLEWSMDSSSSEFSGDSDLLSDFGSGSDSVTLELAPPPPPLPFHLTALKLVGGSDFASSRSPVLIGPLSPRPERLGRFRILEKLGEGGMGEVYKAEDEADGSHVAVKLLRPEVAARPASLERFRKEARLLARVTNPYVTNLLGVYEDEGFHYIVLEYVDGRSLDRDLYDFGRLDEPAALAIGADVARGLMDAHRLGIIHRDVKPANILIVNKTFKSSERASRSGSKLGPVPQRVKLSDFGLARYVEQGETQAITIAGIVVGTPTYMAPEQCSGGAVDARTDVYALGATLFHLVAGRPPFQADDWRGVIAKHLNEPPPSLSRLRPGVSEGFCRVVEKALQKAPSARYADAGALLIDLERLLRGEPTGLPSHPTLPEEDSRKVLRYDFSWDLSASPRQLWPHVSNTDRFDRAIGFGAVKYTLRFDPARGVRRFLEGRKVGMPEEGEEHPYEWVEGRRLGVFRDYARGPFHWVVSVVELMPRAGGGTTLTHRLRLVPRGTLIRLGAGWGIGKGMRNDLEKVYRRIDAAVMGKLGPVATVDPFEPAPDLDPGRRARLDQGLSILQSRGNAPAVVETLGVFLAQAPAPELARIRPIALARKLGLAEEAVIGACLHAANAGLLTLLWDLLCPVCRVSSEVKDTLRDLAEHGHCEACNLDFALDFANSVELIFRAHPGVREADVNTYCAAGPAFSPHVVAQIRVHPSERFELELDLTPGAYRLVGPQLGWSFDFRVAPGNPTNRWDLSLTEGPIDDLPPALAPGGQTLALTNDSSRELLVRVERTAMRDDALTAARASSLAVFRELFPAEVLAPGRLVSVSKIALLLTALDEPANFYETIGDARAFAVLHEQFRLIDEVVRREGGAVVKTVGEGVLAAFADAVSALRAGLQIPIQLASGETTGALRLRMAAHRGPVMATTINDHLDYFGTTVHHAERALSLARGGAFVLTVAMASDPDVGAHLTAIGLSPSVIEGDDTTRPFGLLVVLPLGSNAPIVRTTQSGLRLAEAKASVVTTL